MKLDSIVGTSLLRRPCLVYRYGLRTPGDGRPYEGVPRYAIIVGTSLLRRPWLVHGYGLRTPGDGRPYGGFSNI